jgi:hypothetical protein
LKISIQETLSESLLFYKKNFKYLISFSIIVTLFLGGGELLLNDFLLLMHENYSLRELLIATIVVLIGIVGIIAFIIYIPKLYLAIVILINSLFDEKKITLKDAYTQTKGKYGVALGSLVLIFIMAGFSGYIFQSWNISFPFAFNVHILFGAFIWALYFMIWPVIALGPTEKGYLKRARQMIKGNYEKVLLLYLLTTSLLTIFFRSLAFAMGNTINALGVTFIHYLIFFFVFPFAEVVKVMVYRKLVRCEISEDEEEIIEEKI